MNYEGKLYGKVNKSYFPLEMTSTDVDKLIDDRKMLIELLRDICEKQSNPKFTLASMNGAIDKASKIISKII